VADCAEEVADHKGNPGSGAELVHDIGRAEVAVAAKRYTGPPATAIAG